VLAGRYAIEQLLGDGAMGVVYRARHVKVGRPFAIKVLKPRAMTNPKMVRRFEREAELAGRLFHRNVVPVVDTGTTDGGLHYLVMELAAGHSLAHQLDGRPLPATRVIALGRQLCEGLQHAHDAGLVHRDFKPDNVIIGRDERGTEVARIVDFGVAILREEPEPGDGGRLTTAGIVVGTPQYMSPEQARGDAIDHRTDLFALGVMLYELVTGKPPFDGDGVEVARANLLDATPAMAARAPGVEVDPRLEALVRRLMEKDPAARPQTAAEAEAALDAIAAELATPPKPKPRAETRPGTADPEVAIATDRVHELVVRRRRRIAIACALAVVAMVAIAAAWPRVEGATTPSADVEAPAEAPTLDVRQAVAVAGVGAGTGTATGSGTVTGTGTGTAAGSAAKRTPPTASELATLYASVGRELKALGTRKGDDATIDLWPRYRWIRINEEISAPAARRGDIADMLDQLHRDIAAR